MNGATPILMQPRWYEPEPCFADEPSMPRCKELRRRVDLPVKMTGVDSCARHFSIMCSVFDVTSECARLGGVAASLLRNQTVFLHRGNSRARFKVRWLGSGIRNGECGVKIMEADKLLWQTAFPIQRSQQPGPRGPIRERRIAPRYLSSGSVEVFTTSSQFPLRAELADISASGLYARAFSPFPKGTSVRIRTRVEDCSFDVEAEVATGDPGVGMGFRFVQISEESLAALSSLLQKLQEAEQARTKESAAPAKAVS